MTGKFKIYGNTGDVIRYEYKHIVNKSECDEYLVKSGYKISSDYPDPEYNKIAQFNINDGS
jgi:hypothetical protein